MDSPGASCRPSAFDVRTPILSEDGKTIASSHEFPEGIFGVLVVDGNQTQLQKLTQMLEQICFYRVTTCTSGESAITLLGKKKRHIDIVLCDSCLPDMDTFALLKCIGLEMNLPVIMMSENDEMGLVMKSIACGAWYHATKPLGMETLKNLWQHVFWRKRIEQDDETRKASMTDKGSVENLKRKSEGEEENELEHGDSPKSKKRRVVWTPELHKQFIDAVYKLGGAKKATPKKICEFMNNTELGRQNVASHLQKYRLYLAETKAAENQEKIDTQAPSGVQEASNGSAGLCNVSDSQVPVLRDSVSPPSFMDLETASIGVLANTSMHNFAAINQRRDHLVVQQNNQISTGYTEVRRWHYPAMQVMPDSTYRRDLSRQAHSPDQSALQNSLVGWNPSNHFCPLNLSEVQASPQQPRTMQSNTGSLGIHGLSGDDAASVNNAVEEDRAFWETCLASGYQ